MRTQRRHRYNVAASPFAVSRAAVNGKDDLTTVENPLPWRGQTDTALLLNNQATQMIEQSVVPPAQPTVPADVATQQVPKMRVSTSVMPRHERPKVMSEALSLMYPKVQPTGADVGQHTITNRQRRAQRRAMKAASRIAYTEPSLKERLSWGTIISLILGFSVLFGVLLYFGMTSLAPIVNDINICP